MSNTAEMGMSVDEATEALYREWTKESEEGEGELVDKPVDESAEDEQVETEEGSDEEGSDEEGSDEEGSDEDEAADEAADEQDAPPAIDDDAEVVVRVDGQDRKATVKELKRLYGQEAALTRKSQEVAGMRKKASELLEAQVEAFKAMAERAEKRARPYKDVDLRLEANRLEPEVYEALRDDMRSALGDLRFYQSGMKDALAKQRDHQRESRNKTWEATKKELADPSKGIADWSDTTENKIREYASSQGIPEDALAQAVDPHTWRALYKAMLYDALPKQSQAKVDGKVKPGKKTASAKGTASSRPQVKKKASEAIKKARATTGIQSVEAAADALLSRWGITQ